MTELRGRGEVPLPLPPGFHEIQSEELSRLFGRAVSIRLWAIPVATGVGLTVGALGPAPWRLVAIGCALVAFAVIAVAEWARYRRGEAGGDSIPVNVALMSLFQLFGIFVTGALESPFVPVVLPLAVASAVVIGRRPLLLAVTVPQVLAIWIFALGALYGALPDVQLPPLALGARAGHSDAHLWTSAAALTFFLGVATSVGLLLRGFFDQVLARALVAREQELAAHRDHAAELDALSGEIAHELKNPLATIKGLAALLERDAQGRSAERLAVLRAEVERMQATLEEFLTFSRPLVPLAEVDVDLGALAREVSALHEGVARGRGLRVEVEDDGAAPVRGDRRKLRQVLINLVQNALDASPAGETVLVQVRDGGLDVLDRGAGPPGDLGERVFEPGVTTKDTGNGLGLTIARALARQHGGDLRLAPRDGGGCRASLTLSRRSS